MSHPSTRTNRVGLGSVFALLLALVCCCPSAQAFTLEDGSVAPAGSSNALDLQGNPLRVWSDDFLRVWIYREDPDIEATGYYPQYTGYYRPTLRITKGSGTEVCGDHRSDAFSFSPVSIVRDPDNLANGIISTVTSDSGNLQIVHKLTHVSGDLFVRHEWTVTNLGTETYSNVALRYGGDTFHGIANEARGYFDAATKTLYCVNSDPSLFGLMTMQAASGADFAKYIEGFYTTVNSAMNSSGNFPSAVNVDKLLLDTSEYSNNGMAVEWGYYTLAPAGTFTVTLFERWTDPGLLQVLAPPGFATENGTQHTVTFRVQNFDVESPDVSLSLSAPEGWVESYTLAPLNLPANAIADVAVDIYIPVGYTQDGVIQIAASGATTTQYGSVLVDVVPTSLPTGGDLPLSTLTRTIYTAINPCTPEGITSLISAISGRSPLLTRAFAWDSYQGRYIELPENELTGYLTGGVQVTTGIFIATRVPLAYDLNGSQTAAPFEFVVLNGADPEVNPGTASGWTFAGLPPIEVSPGNIQAAYTWPSSFEIIHNGVIISEFSVPSVMDLMGVPGSSDVSTSRPWRWNGSRYEQETTDTLRSGEGYWFKNNDVINSITIRVLDQSVRSLTLTESITDATRPVTIRSASGVAPSAPGAPVLRDRGAPPAPPDDRANGSSGAASSSGGGCGSGSGIGMLSMLMLFFGLRLLLVVRR